MQGNDATAAVRQQKNGAITPDMRRTAHALLATRMRAAAAFIEASGGLIEAMHDLLCGIRADLIATSGSVRAETAEQLGALLDKMEGK